MRRKIVLFIIIILFVLFSFFIYSFLKSIKEDQSLTKKKMKEILNSYKLFSNDIKSFAESREELYNLLDDTYIEDFSQNYEDWNTYIENYEKEIMKVDKGTKVLKESCFIKFVSVEVNNACTNFKANYEAAMNYYITDIKNYNKIVENYNEWAKENNKGLLNKGKLVIYKKYIDFDKDGEYFGREDSND